jgi:hypothetical protein
MCRRRLQPPQLVRHVISLVLDLLGMRRNEDEDEHEEDKPAKQHTYET